jgi:hypothetical protein
MSSYPVTLKLFRHVSGHFSFIYTKFWDKTICALRSRETSIAKPPETEILIVNILLAVNAKCPRKFPRMLE